jgi:hypothetical protein
MDKRHTVDLVRVAKGGKVLNEGKAIPKLTVASSVMGLSSVMSVPAYSGQATL